MPNWKKVIVSGSDAILNEVTASSGLDTTDVTIDGWGSVSSSLASIEAGGASQTLQDVTDNGSTTTNLISAPGITINSSGSDFLKLGLDAGENASNGAIVGDGGVIIGTNALRDFNGTTEKATIVGNYTAVTSTNFGDLVTLVGSTIAQTGNIGNYTTAVGAQALSGQTGGNEGNTAIGTSALFNFKGGKYNIALGYNSGPQAILTGSEGIYIGREAGTKHNSNNVPPSQSIYIGTEAKSTFGSSYGAAMTVNEIVIGNNVNGNGTNTVTIGNSSTTNNYFSGNISGSDVTIDDWGSISASLSSIDSSIDNYGEWNLAGEADTTDVTSQKFVKFTGGQSITGTGTEANPYIMTIVPSSLGNTTTIDSTSDAQLILDRAANSNDSEILFKTNGTTNWSIGTGQIGSETEFTFKGQDGANYIRINQSGQADFLSAVTASAVHVGDYTEIESNRLTIADGADATVTQLAVATYCGVFVDYTIYSTDAGQTNMRTGTYRAVFNDSEVQDSETMTNDIGDTNGFVLSVSLDGTNFTLTANNDIGQQCRVSYTVKPIKL